MTLQGRMKWRAHFARAVVEVARIRANHLARRWCEVFELSDSASLAGLCHVQAAAIESALEDMLEAHQLVHNEIGEDAEARQGHEEAWGALTEDVRYLQTRLMEDAGERLVEALGLLEPPPKTPGSLERYAERAVERLLEVEREIEPRFGGGYRTSALAQRLAGTLVMFRRAMAGLERETRETRQAYEMRDVALAEFERVLFNGCRVLEGLFRQAELYEYAEIVRPSSLRIQGRLEEDPLPS